MNSSSSWDGQLLIEEINHTELKLDSDSTNDKVIHILYIIPVIIIIGIYSYCSSKKRIESRYTENSSNNDDNNNL